MTEGRQKDSWDRMATLLCMLHNTNCGKDARKKPDHFNPFKQPNKVDMGNDISALKMLVRQ